MNGDLITDAVFVVIQTETRQYICPDKVMDKYRFFSSHFYCILGYYITKTARYNLIVNYFIPHDYDKFETKIDRLTDLKIIINNGRIETYFEYMPQSQRNLLLHCKGFENFFLNISSMRDKPNLKIKIVTYAFNFYQT